MSTIRAYHGANDSFPDKIIVYRDGVGAGDIQNVLDIELEGIKVRLSLNKTHEEVNPQQKIVPRKLVN